MKKVIVLFVFFVALMSCKKDDVYCWQCNTETIGDQYYSSHVYTVCGMTYDERVDFELSNSYTSGEMRIVTNCKLDE